MAESVFMFKYVFRPCVAIGLKKYKVSLLYAVGHQLAERHDTFIP